MGKEADVHCRTGGLDQAEQDNSKPEDDADTRPGDTKNVRQSPTIHGAVARYGTSPIGNVYDKLIT